MNKFITTTTTTTIIEGKEKVGHGNWSIRSDILSVRSSASICQWLTTTGIPLIALEIHWRCFSSYVKVFSNWIEKLQSFSPKKTIVIFRNKKIPSPSSSFRQFCIKFKFCDRFSDHRNISGFVESSFPLEYLLFIKKMNLLQINHRVSAFSLSSLYRD